MRSLVPADTLVYLETNDLAAALEPIVDNKAFEAVANSKPDFSALKGVQLAVAVTGFETTEDKLTDEHSVGRIQPRFVAIIDTHAWNWQAVAFADQKLGQFVTNIYGADVTQDRTDSNNGEYFTWTSNDGRKSYAQVIDSLVYFSTDEASIDKCLAVRRGETESLSKNSEVPSGGQYSTSGYVSSDGVAQIANIIGLKFASEVGDDSEIQSAVAGILPQLLRNSITNIKWFTNKTDYGIEDTYLVRMPPDVGNVLDEMLKPSKKADLSLLEFIPADAPMVTLYNLERPQIAWRSILMTAQKQTDPLSGKMIVEFSAVFFEPFGIRDVESFFGSIGTNIITTSLQADNEMRAVVARVNDVRKLKGSLHPDLKQDKASIEGSGIEIWKSGDGDIAAAFFENNVILGDTDSVIKCLEAKKSGNSFARSSVAKRMIETNGSSVTIGKDAETAEQIADIFSERKDANVKTSTTFTTETNFQSYGFRRSTVSDFGLIGSIIAQLGGED